MSNQHPDLEEMAQRLTRVAATFDFEEAADAAAGVAQVWVVYHQALRNGGLPARLANTLTSMYAEVTLHQTLCAECRGEHL